LEGFAENVEFACAYQWPSRGVQSLNSDSLQPSISTPGDLGTDLRISYSPPISSPLSVVSSSGITSSALERAIYDPISIVHEADDGSILAGTVEGLVDRLISDFPGA
jgi:hypothetical protein